MTHTARIFGDNLARAERYHDLLATTGTTRGFPAKPPNYGTVTSSTVPSLVKPSQPASPSPTLVPAPACPASPSPSPAPTSPFTWWSPS